MYMVSYALIVLQSDCVKEISEVGVCYDAICNSGPVCNSGSSIVHATENEPNEPLIRESPPGQLRAHHGPWLAAHRSCDSNDSNFR